MTNQSSILNEHDLKELARMAMNIILEKYIYIYWEPGLVAQIVHKNITAISNIFST